MASTENTSEAETSSIQPNKQAQLAPVWRGTLSLSNKGVRWHMETTLYATEPTEAAVLTNSFGSLMSLEVAGVCERRLAMAHVRASTAEGRVPELRLRSEDERAQKFHDSLNLRSTAAIVELRSINRTLVIVPSNGELCALLAQAIELEFTTGDGASNLPPGFGLLARPPAAQPPEGGRSSSPVTIEDSCPVPFVDNTSMLIAWSTELRFTLNHTSHVVTVHANVNAPDMNILEMYAWNGQLRLEGICQRAGAAVLAADGEDDAALISLHWTSEQPMFREFWDALHTSDWAGVLHLHEVNRTLLLFAEMNPTTRAPYVRVVSVPRLETETVGTFTPTKFAPPPSAAADDGDSDDAADSPRVNLEDFLNQVDVFNTADADSCTTTTSTIVTQFVVGLRATLDSNADASWSTDGRSFAIDLMSFADGSLQRYFGRKSKLPGFLRALSSLGFIKNKGSAQFSTFHHSQGLFSRDHPERDVEIFPRVAQRSVSRVRGQLMRRSVRIRTGTTKRIAAPPTIDEDELEEVDDEAQEEVAETPPHGVTTTDSIEEEQVSQPISEETTSSIDAIPTSPETPVGKIWSAREIRKAFHHLDELDGNHDGDNAIVEALHASLGAHISEAPARWVRNGASVIVHDAERFEAEVLTNYHGRDKMRAFARLLYSYGFTRGHVIQRRGKEDILLDHWSHDMFHRDHPEWIGDMRRVALRPPNGTASDDDGVGDAVVPASLSPLTSPRHTRGSRAATPTQAASTYAMPVPRKSTPTKATAPPQPLLSASAATSALTTRARSESPSVVRLSIGPRAMVESLRAQITECKALQGALTRQIEADRKSLVTLRQTQSVLREMNENRELTQGGPLPTVDISPWRGPLPDKRTPRVTPVRSREDETPGGENNVLGNASPMDVQAPTPVRSMPVVQISPLRTIESNLPPAHVISDVPPPATLRPLSPSPQSIVRPTAVAADRPLLVSPLRTTVVVFATPETVVPALPPASTSPAEEHMPLMPPVPRVIRKRALDADEPGAMSTPTTTTAAGDERGEAPEADVAPEPPAKRPHRVIKPRVAVDTNVDTTRRATNAPVSSDLRVPPPPEVLLRPTPRSAFVDPSHPFV